MGTTIDALAVEIPSVLHIRRGAVDLAVRAARTCFEDAGIEPHDVDLLINAGIYREEHLGEPALAALIQDDLHANAELQSEAGAHGTFSFDVLNGVCGVLSAFQLADTLLRAGTIRRAVVVGEDTKPGRGADFPFTPAGAAALLSWSDEAPGLIAHRMETHVDGRDDFTSIVSWHDRAHRLPGMTGGHNTLTIERTDAFETVAAEAAARSLSTFLDERRLSLGADDCLVVAGVADPAPLVATLGLEGCPMVTVPARLGGAHTAAPIAALAAAREAGHLAGGDVVLLAVAAGITVGIAHYRARPVTAP